MNGIEPASATSYPHASGSCQNENTRDLLGTQCELMDAILNDSLSSPMFGDPEENARGMTKIIPSNINMDADYWLLLDTDVSITDMWNTDACVNMIREELEPW